MLVRRNVLRGSPEEVLLEFMAERGAALLTFETHEEPHARARDAAVRGAAEKRRIRVEQHCSDTLWEPAQLLAQKRVDISGAETFPSSWVRCCHAGITLLVRLPVVPGKA